MNRPKRIFFVSFVVWAGPLIASEAPRKVLDPQMALRNVPLGEFQPSAYTQDNLNQRMAQDTAQLLAQAESGDAAAQMKLARAYESGLGVPKDDQLAARWYRRAAEQGDPEAENALGEKYLIGEGIERDKEEATKWFRKSARQGNATAMYHLGAAYYNGDGVGIDDSLSYAWFRLAKEAGNQNAADAVQRAESELKPQTITSGFERIAEMYEKGDSLPGNQAEAARWWSFAAARGDYDAQVALAVNKLNGQGNAQEYSEARHLCEEVAKQRQEPRAEYCLGYLSAWSWC